MGSSSEIIASLGLFSTLTIVIYVEGWRRKIPDPISADCIILHLFSFTLKRQNGTEIFFCSFQLQERADKLCADMCALSLSLSLSPFSLSLTLSLSLSLSLYIS
jgi:hypothetical protein